MVISLTQPRIRRLFVCLVTLIVFHLIGCQTKSTSVRPNSSTASYVAAATRDADKLRIVECLLPPRIHRLGTKITYLAARQVIQTSAGNCEIRGGEYVLFDPARPDTFDRTLVFWRPQAESGDPAAQTRIGEIYEQGSPPDYVKAAFWYRQASQQGFAPAKINLGQLYEKGLGVEKDSLKALNLYREASGLKGQLTFGGADVSQLENEVKRLREQVAFTQKELQSTRAQLQNRNTEVKTLEQRIRQLDQRIEAQPESSQALPLQNERDALRVELQQLRRERAQLESRIASSQQQLAETNRQLQQRDREVASLENRISKLEQQINTASVSSGEAEHLRQEKRQLAVELENLRRERETLQQRIASIEQMPAKTPRGPNIKILFPPIDVAPVMRNLRIIKTLPNVQHDVWGIVLDSAGLQHLTVNDRQATLDKNGLFHVQVPIASSDVVVKVRVQDRNGQSKTVQFLFSPQGMATTAPVLAGTKLRLGKYHALVIGNAKYENITNLNTPIHDARTVARLLKTHYGFEEVRLLENANRLELLSAFDKFRERLTEEDNLLIFYAGHGQLVKEEKVQFIKGYWLPIDAQPNRLATWISNDDITAQIKLMRAKHVMIIADSCYSGTLTRSAVPELKQGMTLRERIERYKEMAKKRSRTVLTSGGVEPVLDSLGGEHSVFAKHFIRVLEENNDVLEGLSLYEKVFKPVKQDAASVGVNQSPEYAPVKYAGHQATDFLLAPAEIRTAAAIAAGSTEQIASLSVRSARARSVTTP